MKIAGSIALLTVALAIATGLTACGGGDSATPEEKLCNSLADFRDSLDSMKDLNITSSSLDDVQEAVEEIADAAGKVAEAAKGVASADVSELQASAAGLQTALKDFPSPGSIQAISEGIGTIGAAGEQAIEDLDCDTSS